MQKENPFTITRWENEREDWLVRRGESRKKSQSVKKSLQVHVKEETEAKAKIRDVVNKTAVELENATHILREGTMDIRRGISDILMYNESKGISKCNDGIKDIESGIEQIEYTLENESLLDESEGVCDVQEALQGVQEGLRRIRGGLKSNGIEGICETLMGLLGAELSLQRVGASKHKLEFKDSRKGFWQIKKGIILIRGSQTDIEDGVQIILAGEITKGLHEVNEGLQTLNKGLDNIMDGSRRIYDADKSQEKIARGTSLTSEAIRGILDGVQKIQDGEINEGAAKIQEALRDADRGLQEMEIES